VSEPAAPAFTRQLRVMNDIYRDEARKREWVRFIDSADILGKGGAYTQYLADESGRTLQVRESDGLHLTRVGGERLAASVMDAIASDWLAERKR
jgi:hypothetical protein